MMMSFLRPVILMKPSESLIDHTQTARNDVALALPGEQSSLFRNGEIIPLGVPLADCVGAVCFSQSVRMDRAEVQLLDPVKQRGRRRSSANRHRDLLVEAVRFRVVDQENLDSGGSVVVGDAFGLEEVPD